MTKKNSTGEKEEKKGKVKVGKLQRNREAVTDLTDSEQKQIKGGVGVACPKWVCGSNHNETLVRDAAPMR